MNVRRVVLMSVLCFGFCFTAGAFTLDGGWSDWFTWTGDGGSSAYTSHNVSGGSGGNLWDAPDSLNAGVKYFGGGAADLRGDGGIADSNAPFTLPWGAAAPYQSYDVEAIVSALAYTNGIDDTAGYDLWFGMVTGYNEYDASANDGFEAGELFLDLNGTIDPPGSVGLSAWDYAIGTSLVHSRLGILYKPTLTTTTTAYFSGGNPYRVSGWSSSSAAGVESDAIWGGGDETSGGDGDGLGVDGHNFLEGYIHLSAGQGNALQTDAGAALLTWHWTMECGNDWVTSGVTGHYEPQIPIPEPATVALLLLGLVGFAARKRFYA
jgi:hypothetical protein